MLEIPVVRNFISKTKIRKSSSVAFTETQTSPVLLHCDGATKHKGLIRNEKRAAWGTLLLHLYLQLSYSQLHRYAIYFYLKSTFTNWTVVLKGFPKTSLLSNNKTSNHNVEEQQGSWDGVLRGKLWTVSQVHTAAPPAPAGTTGTESHLDFLVRAACSRAATSAGR